MTPQVKLLESAKSGNIGGIKEAIRDGADPKLKDSLALGCAANKGHLECVELLIPVSEPKDNDSWALLTAACNGHVECVKLLIPVSEPRIDNSKALKWAAVNGHVECVKLLIPVSDCEVALNTLEDSVFDETGEGETKILLESLIQESALHGSYVANIIREATLKSI